MKTTDTYFLMVLELEVQPCQGPALSEGPGGGPVLASLLLPVVAGNPWRSLACSCITPIPPSVVTRHSLCVFCLYFQISIISSGQQSWDEGPP